MAMTVIVAVVPPRRYIRTNPMTAIAICKITTAAITTMVVAMVDRGADPVVWLMAGSLPDSLCA